VSHGRRGPSARGHRLRRAVGDCRMVPARPPSLRRPRVIRRPARHLRRDRRAGEAGSARATGPRRGSSEHPSKARNRLRPGGFRPGEPGRATRHCAVLGQQRSGSGDAARTPVHSRRGRQRRRVSRGCHAGVTSGEDLHGRCETGHRPAALPAGMLSCTWSLSRRCHADVTAPSLAWACVARHAGLPVPVRPVERPAADDTRDVGDGRR